MAPSACAAGPGANAQVFMRLISPEKKEKKRRSREGSTVFTSRCVGSLRQGRSHSLTVCNFPSIAFFLLSSCLTSPAPLICYTSAPALFLFASPPFCSPWWKVVILISLSPADPSPLYLSNYLSALSSRPTPPSIQSASM